MAEGELNNNKGTNVPKYKAIMCHPGAIRYGVSEESVGQRIMGRVMKYKERLRRRMSCPGCRVELTTGSMTAHQSLMHRTDSATK